MGSLPQTRHIPRPYLEKPNQLYLKLKLRIILPQWSSRRRNFFGRRIGKKIPQREKPTALEKKLSQKGFQICSVARFQPAPLFQRPPKSAKMPPRKKKPRRWIVSSPALSPRAIGISASHFCSYRFSLPQMILVL